MGAVESARDHDHTDATRRKHIFGSFGSGHRSRPQAEASDHIFGSVEGREACEPTTETAIANGYQFDWTTSLAGCQGAPFLRAMYSDTHSPRRRHLATGPSRRRRQRPILDPSDCGHKHWRKRRTTSADDQVGVRYLGARSPQRRSRRGRERSCRGVVSPTRRVSAGTVGGGSAEGACICDACSNLISIEKRKQERALLRSLPLSSYKGISHGSRERCSRIRGRRCSSGCRSDWRGRRHGRRGCGTAQPSDTDAPTH